MEMLYNNQSQGVYLRSSARFSYFLTIFRIIMMKKQSSLLFLFCFLVWACGSEPKTDHSAPSNQEQAKTTDTKPAATSKRHIVFFGNSLTAAYGLDPSEGFVGVLQDRIDSLGLPYRTVNAGLSGETTAGGNSRVEWILDQQAIDIFILELGGNDGLRGIDPADSYKNLKSIIEKVKAKDDDIQIVLAGMEAPPNMGPEFTTEFRQNYARLAKEYDLPLIPFLLDKVGGVPELNLEDGIHPTAKGHRIVAENIWKVLAPLLDA